MARGRSLPEFERLYLDGYDMNAYMIDCGERGVEFDLGEFAAVADVGRGVIPGRVTPSFGPVNGVFDNTPSSGIHVLAAAAQGARRYILHVRGVQAIPAIGDDCFCMVGRQSSYKGVGSDPAATVHMTFGNDASFALAYLQYFGVLLHAFGSETGANAANTNADNGAASAGGGWLLWMIRSITGSGTVTVSVEESDTGTSGWAALTGATSGAIATASAPLAGVVQLATDAAVKQYLRWQIAFGGSATAATWILAFMRG